MGEGSGTGNLVVEEERSNEKERATGGHFHKLLKPGSTYSSLARAETLSLNAAYMVASKSLGMTGDREIKPPQVKGRLQLWNRKATIQSKGNVTKRPSNSHLQQSGGGGRDCRALK